MNTGDALCSCCAARLDDEEAADPRHDEDGNVLCDACYSDHYEYVCPLCGNLVEIEDNQQHIVVTTALAYDQRMQPGIYKLVELPWFVSNYFSLTIRQSCVEKVGDLPTDLLGDIPGSYVCEACAQSNNNNDATASQKG